MTKFTETVTATLKNGDELKVLHDGSTNISDVNLASLSKQMVDNGRDAMWAAISAIKRYPNVSSAEHNKLHHLLRVCFLISTSRTTSKDYQKTRRDYGTPPTSSEKAAQELKQSLSKISSNLSRSLTGATGPQTIQVGALPGSKTVGRVKFHDLVKNKDSSPSWPVRNVIKDLATGHHAVWGPISIDKSIIQNGVQATNTYVHEATHKFAGTDDKFYIEYWNKADAKKKNHFKVKEVTAENALINADSYGHFAQRFWTMKNTILPTESDFDLTDLGL